MTGLLYFILAFGSLVGSHADVNISDFVYWKKQDINQYHQFFPSRALEEERRTIEAALSAVQSISSIISDDCSKIVAFQYRELQTAQQLMAGTDAEGCVSGISHFLDQAIQDQVDSYDDCTADVLSKLVRINNIWTRTKTTYLTAYQRALSGIDACAKNYPNKGSIDRLRSCVESMKKNYFVVANSTQSSVFPSPSMTYFQSTVVDCASTAAEEVAAKGSQFLKMLVDCAALSGTVDPTSYAEELSHWKGYNDTLSSQIVNSQNSNYYQVFAVEMQMTHYYRLQKEALERYVVESRGLDFYQNKIYLYLNDYYNTVTATSLDNPAESGCAAAARNSLDKTVNTSATLTLSCDESVVNDTKRLMTDVYNRFAFLNLDMPSIGNVALLNCLSQGLVFAPNTIEKCFHLSYTEFEIDSAYTLDLITKDTLILSDYISSFFNNTQLPCGDFSLKMILLDAEKVLYDLKRCLYQFSGTSYEVTTTVYTTISPRTNTTPQPSTSGSTTCWCPCNTSTEEYQYNTTTEPYPYNRTTRGYTYNTTTEAYPYNRTTSGYTYNTTTEAYPYNRTTSGYTYSTTTEAYPYSRTTSGYTNNTTTESHTDSRTTIGQIYNPTSESHTERRSTIGHPYNPTSESNTDRRSSIGHAYNPTTESNTDKRSTIGHPYNPTSESNTDRRSSIGHAYNPTTESNTDRRSSIGHPYNPTSESNTDRRSTIGHPYNPTTESYTYDRTTRRHPHSTPPYTV